MKKLSKENSEEQANTKVNVEEQSNIKKINKNNTQVVKEKKNKKENFKKTNKNKSQSRFLDLIDEQLSEIKQSLSKVFELITDQINTEPKDLYEIADLYSSATDKIIIQGQEEGNEFVGGKFKIRNIRDPKKIELYLELYFLDGEKKWIKKDDNQLIHIKNLTKEAEQELISEGEVIYEVESPISNT